MNKQEYIASRVRAAMGKAYPDAAKAEAKAAQLRSYGATVAACRRGGEYRIVDCDDLAAYYDCQYEGAWTHAHEVRLPVLAERVRRDADYFQRVTDEITAVVVGAGSGATRAYNKGEHAALSVRVAELETKLDALTKAIGGGIGAPRLRPGTRW